MKAFQILFLSVITNISLIGLYITAVHLVWSISPEHAKILVLCYLLNIGSRMTLSSVVTEFLEQKKDKLNGTR